MREDRARAAGENCGHESAPKGEELGRDQRVDGLVDAVQLPDPYAFMDDGIREARIAQVRQAQDGVLAGRDLRDR
jgi:hypothetical protein